MYLRVGSKIMVIQCLLTDKLLHFLLPRRKKKRESIANCMSLKIVFLHITLLETLDSNAFDKEDLKKNLIILHQFFK